MAITMITLSGAELDEQGNPLSGYITFTLSAALIDAADDYTLSPAVVTVATNPADGTWSTVLAATKGDAGITPTGVTYTVTKRLGSHTERFSIELDAAGGATQDLADITPSTNIVTATYDAAGAAALVQAHLDTHAAASDPHPVYLTAAEGAALPFDAAGAASTVQGNLTTHGNLTTTAHGGLVASTDARLTDARTPTVHHTTHNMGQSDAIAPGDIGAATAGALTTHTGLTTTAHGGLVASNDSRLTDARTPTAHATTHETGGSDPVYANLGSDSTARVESILRWIAGGSAVLVTQGATFAYFTPRINLTISNLLVAGNSNATSVTLVRMGLYTAAGNGDLTLVARCAADATLLATAGTIYTRVLDTTGGYPASYALVRGTRYAFGIVAVFTGTAPQVRSVLGSGQLFALDPIQTLFKAGQADLPTSQTFASGAITGNLIWMAAT